MAKTCRNCKYGNLDTNDRCKICFDLSMKNNSPNMKLWEKVGK